MNEQTDGFNLLFGLIGVVGFMGMILVVILVSEFFQKKDSKTNADDKEKDQESHDYRRRFSGDGNRADDEKEEDMDRFNDACNHSRFHHLRR